MDASGTEERGNVFPNTRWTLVSRIRGGRGGVAAQALEEICRTYWYPLYVYARRFGLDEPDAKDMVQELFAGLLQNDGIARADMARGRLRTFLLTGLKNVIGKAWEKQQAAKRGGGQAALSLDMEDAEGRYLHEPVGREISPERAFERKWALELLQVTKRKLGKKYSEEGKSRLFEVLAPALLDSAEWKGHHEAAEILGMNDDAVKVALHRLRERYRKALLAEVRDTLDDDAGDAGVKDEVSYLLGLFGEKA